MCLCVILNKRRINAGSTDIKSLGTSSTAPISQYSFVDVFCNKYVSNSDENLEHRFEIYFKPLYCSCIQNPWKLLYDISCRFSLWNVTKVGQQIWKIRIKIHLRMSVKYARALMCRKAGRVCVLGCVCVRVYVCMCVCVYVCV